MRLYKLIFIFITIWACCKSNYLPVKDDYKPIYSSQQILEKLEKYYKDSLTDSLFNFIKDWNSQIPNQSDKYINQNDTIRNIYELFNEMYQPLQFGNHRAEYDYQIKDEFIAIQNYIKYTVVSDKIFDDFISRYKRNSFDSVYNNYKTNTITNFRPSIKWRKDKNVYLTEEYNNAITKFLGTGNDKIAEKEIQTRYKFISKYLYICKGHWGGWHLSTFPIIRKITFNDSFDRALIDFRIESGRTAIQYKLQKENGKWIDKDNKIIYGLQE